MITQERLYSQAFFTPIKTQLKKFTADHKEMQNFKNLPLIPNGKHHINNGQINSGKSLFLLQSTKL